MKVGYNKLLSTFAFNFNLRRYSKGDGVVNSLNEKRVFGSASEAKSVVDYVTGGLIGSFIVISAILAAGASTPLAQ